MLSEGGCVWESQLVIKDINDAECGAGLDWHIGSGLSSNGLTPKNSGHNTYTVEETKIDNNGTEVKDNIKLQPLFIHAQSVPRYFYSAIN